MGRLVHLTSLLCPEQEIQNGTQCVSATDAKIGIKCKKNGIKISLSSLFSSIVIFVRISGVKNQVFIGNIGLTALSTSE